MSTTTSTIEPRAQRTSLACPPTGSACRAPRPRASASGCPARTRRSMPSSASTLRAVGLDEEAALVAVHHGFDEEGAVEVGVDPAHRPRRLVQTRARRGRRSAARAPATRSPPATARCARAGHARSRGSRSRRPARRRGRAPARACRRSRARSPPAPSSGTYVGRRPRERALVHGVAQPPSTPGPPPAPRHPPGARPGERAGEVAARRQQRRRAERHLAVDVPA